MISRSPILFHLFYMDIHFFFVYMCLLSFHSSRTDSNIKSWSIFTIKPTSNLDLSVMHFNLNVLFFNILIFALVKFSTNILNQPQNITRPNVQIIGLSTFTCYCMSSYINEVGCIHCP